MSDQARKLRSMIEAGGTLVVPGGGSPLDMLLAEQAGFTAGYISGYATSAQRFGLPDIGQIAFAEMTDMARACSAVVSIPLIVDADTGYGDVANVARTVRGLEAAGAAAIQLEDQTWPKRCGHMDGRVVESREVAVRKIAAALAARRDPSTVIIARTDSAGPHGLDEALERCRLFKAEGADVMFVDGPGSTEELRLIGRESPGPRMANMSETGKTPLHTADELGAMGFTVVIFPSSLARITIASARGFLADLRRTGDSRGWLDRMASLDEANATVGIDAVRAFETAILERPHHGT
ncbi:isocitrate lyase/PEP mutase family protein [Humitalea sp. 24SJ18S-53]|uniref:isocitrate lyase/PEP mutase family protein n=1 Tax=Humitalea sp. 24SJ18S-53 TaxID=3422307 RepID=UPI003D6643AF